MKIGLRIIVSATAFHLAGLLGTHFSHAKVHIQVLIECFSRFSVRSP